MQSMEPEGNCLTREPKRSVEDLPSPKKFCKEEKCSTPIPSQIHNEVHVDLNTESFESFDEREQDEVAAQELSQHDLDDQESFIDEVEDEQEAALSDGIGLNNESFESFIDEVEEEQDEIAAQELSQHGLDDQSFSDFLQDVAEDPQTGASAIAKGDENSDTYTLPTAILNGLVFPKQVLENILSRLSLVDLYTSARLVCRLWNSVVSAESFVRWKWMYHKSKHDSSMLPSFVVEDTSSPLLEIARFVQKEFSQITTELKHILQKHPQYSCVPHLLPSSDKPALTDVGELALLVACCNSVHHLLHLVHLLGHPVEGGFSSPVLSYSEISEILYCVAAVFRNTSKISPRFHYNLFYVLEVMERRWEVHVQSEEHNGDGVLASATKLTDEQLRIVNHRFQSGQTVKVLALAGTGKTTTLSHIVRANLHIKFLYCVFNKSVQLHAESSIFRGCPNVKTKTFHGIAYTHLVKEYGKNQLGWDMHPFFMKVEEKLPPLKRISLTKCVKDTLENYFASADDVLDLEKHVVWKNKEDVFPRDLVFYEAQRYWELMKSPLEEEFKLSHDGYLKLFQLRKPARLLPFYQYKVILVDEAQDLSPAIIDLLRSQAVRKVFIGDSNQQIYSFRGASNALNQITATHTYHLTRSFRFGPEISYVCDLALSHFKLEKTQTLIGTLKESSISGYNRTGQQAIICRLNSTLFDEVVAALSAKPNARIGFAGAAKEADLDRKYGLRSIEEIAALQQGADRMTFKTPEVKHCKSFHELVQKAEKARDINLLNRIKVCRKYKEKIPVLIEQIKHRVTYDLRRADIVFTTAHKSKGLEFETVIVTDDYNVELAMEVGVPYDFGAGPTFRDPDMVAEEKEDELNLIYVAMSRAKRNLVLSPQILGVLRKEKFLYPIVSSEGKCNQCLKNPGFLLERPGFRLSTMEKTPHRVCKDCYEEGL